MQSGFSSLPPLNALRVFEVVGRHLNFRYAAVELGVTQAAVAQQIRGLEAALDVRLFERKPRGLELTQAGSKYSASVRSALAIIHEATLTLRPEPSHLTISVTPTFASKWLIPRLGALAEVHQDIDLRVLATDRMSQFQSDGVDIAVRYGRPPFGPGLNVELLMEDRIIAVAAPGLVAEKGRPQAFEHLHDFLLLHDAHNFWPEFSAALFQQPTRPTAKNMRFNQTSLAIEAAIAGQGMALASLAFVADDIKAGRLVQVFEQVMQPDKSFYLVWPRKAQSAAMLDTVRQWLVCEAKSWE